MKRTTETDGCRGAFTSALEIVCDYELREAQRRTDEWESAETGEERAGIYRRGEREGPLCESATDRDMFSAEPEEVPRAMFRSVGASFSRSLIVAQWIYLYPATAALY